MNVDDVEEAYAELEAQREVFRQGVQLDGKDFKTDVIGGAWTKGNKATAGERIKCWGTSKEVKAFCKKFKLGSGEISFAVKLY